MLPNVRKPLLLVTILFALGVVTIAFYPVIAAHFHAVPGIGGDGGKNIFALVYHSLYGKGLHFDGMNYPYGEHVIYIDGQPLLSVPLGYLGVQNAGQVLCSMWLLLLLSYVLAIVFTVRTLQHLGVPQVFAIIFSSLIIVMSPQLLHTPGHFGLSYACVLPMLFFWTIRYHDAPHWKYAVYVFILGFVVNFLHPYLLALVLVWVGLYCVGYLLLTKSSIASKLKHITPLLCGVLLQFAVISMVILATDPVKDRPVTPYGLTVYCTTGIQIFTSYFSPIWKYLDDEKGTIEKSSAYGGTAYPGLVVLAVVIFMVMRFVAKRKNRKSADLTNHETFPSIYLFIAMAALVLAMGVPFVWNMEWLVEYLSFAKQFRTLGRFSWIFYYIITIYGAVTLYQWYVYYLQGQKKTQAYGILSIPILLWSFEASGYVSGLHNKMKDSKTNYELLTNKERDGWPEFLKEHEYKPADFQAILMLPYFHIGTDKLWVGNETAQGEVGEGTIAGIQLHLPWVNALMARSSWGIAQRQVKIAGGCYTDKTMLNDLKSNKPLLLLYSSNTRLNDDQAYLLRSSVYIGTFRDYEAYACFPRRIQEHDKHSKDSIRMLIDALPCKDHDTCIGCGEAGWFTAHFDTGKAEKILWGGTAAPLIQKLETELLTIPMTAIGTTQTYEFSCWFLLGNQNYRSPFFKLDLLDSKGNIINTYDVLAKESTDNNGLWFRASSFLDVSPECVAIKCRLRNEPEDTYIAMDELQLRPVGSTVISWSVLDKHIMINNHLLVQ